MVGEIIIVHILSQFYRGVGKPAIQVDSFAELR